MNEQLIPPQIQQSMMQVQSAARAVEGRDVDMIGTPWPEVEKTVIKLLGGAFDMQRQDHLVIALGLSGFFAARLAKDHGAFWFPNRDSMEGATVGFPEALIMMSPFGAVADSLQSSNLNRLDEIQKDIRNSLAQQKFSVAGAGAPQRLGPEVYMRLFDPGFLQFAMVDSDKVKEALESAPDKLTRDVKDALSRAREIPPDLKQQIQGQIVMALERLTPGMPLIDQASRASRAVELVAHLFGTTAGTGAAPEEFWTDIVLPILHIGAPESFPPLGQEELDAVKQGADPLLLFVDVVPWSTQADEEGLMGVFPGNELSVPHPKMEAIAPLRLIQVPKSRIAPLLEKFDGHKTKASVDAFTKYVSEKAGAPAKTSPEGEQMLAAALTVLTDLKKAVTAGGPKEELCVRRVTEAEAASEAALTMLRKALQGPRLILV